MKVVKRPNVLIELIKALEEGRLIPSFHAQEQMKKRDILMSDLEEALYRAKREDHKDSPTKDGKDWKYSLRGVNESGEKDLRIIIIFDDPKVVVVTAIDKNKKEDDHE